MLSEPAGRNARRPAAGVLVIALLAATAPRGALAEQELLPFGGSWKVWDRDEPPPAGWERPDFDDSAWTAVKAPVAMNVSERMARRQGFSVLSKMRPTTCFRIAFDARRLPPEVVDLELRINLRKDAGLAAYLNGVPVDRRRLPAGFTHQTPSTVLPYFTHYGKTALDIDPKHIRDGRNVLAIRVHLCKPDIRWVLGLDARLKALTDADNTFKAGPIVSGTYRRKACVTFDARFASTAVLKYGKVGSAKDASLRSDRPARTHVMEVAGLDPDTVYAYDLHVTRAGGAAALTHAGGRFRTAPDSPRTFTCAVWGDCRTWIYDWMNVADAMADDDSLEFTIGLGDYVDTGDPYELWEEQFFAPGRRLFAVKPFWAVVGNHDGWPKYYYKLNPSTGGRKAGWWKFTYGDALFVGIDHVTNACRPDKELHQAIEKTLRESDRKYVFVMTHYPVYTSGYHGGLDADTGEPTGRAPKMIYKGLLPLMEKHRITAYIAA
ncbi:MAG: metallophosphoesterase, partial [Planctomycetota bacterium]